MTAVASPSLLKQIQHRAAYVGIRAGLTLPLVAGLQPSLETARIVGRAFGGSSINRKRVTRGAERVMQAFPELDQDGAHELVLRSYEHLAMLAVEIAMAPRMINRTTWSRYVELGEIGDLLRSLYKGKPTVFVTGHMGNWEILGTSVGVIGVPTTAIYRPLDLPPLDTWVRRVRRERGLELLDKNRAAAEVPKLMAAGGRPAFVADQNAGDRGLFTPYFGRLASSYKSIGLVAMQQQADVIVSSAHRIGWDDNAHDEDGRSLGNLAGGARFHLTMEDAITPEEYMAAPDPLFYLTARYRRALEMSVKRHPEQYLWMHRIWKSRPKHERDNKPFPDSLRRKLAELPWMTDADVEAIVDRSDRDRAWLKENGKDRLP
ncbi:MAG: lysophospholipid acyltransferase family protein [Planctomycetota bacterium]